jgi:NADH:ubiquinone oxidoreductase subunit 3 (subunit A)
MAVVNIHPLIISTAAILVFAALFLAVARRTKRDQGVPTAAATASATPQILPFYRMALLAAIFLSAFILLLPWVVGFQDLLATERAPFLAVVVAFVIVLFSALVYAARRGALEWEERSPVTDFDD